MSLTTGGTRLPSPAEEPLCFSLQAEVERKVQNFPQKFPRQFWTSGTCQTFCGMLRTLTPSGGWAVGKAPVKTDTDRWSRKTYFFTTIFSPILSTV